MNDTTQSKPKYRPTIKAKRWNPKFEEEILEEWHLNQTYKFHHTAKKPIFSIDTPPPYASGSWHVGGATHYTQIDMIARVKRMAGFNVIFPMAIDRNGLPIEVQVEQEHNISMYDIPREKFLNLCREFLDHHENEITRICMRLGLSCNSFKKEDITRTDDPHYRSKTQTTFIELWKKGEISEDIRPNNWCPVCRTTIADAEVEYKDNETSLNYLSFSIKETGEILEIATTRPELLPACGCILIHPDDTRYQSLHNKHVIVPLFNKTVPIITSKEAKMDFGTGAMMVCSYGDYTDVRLFRNLRLTPIPAIDPDGKMTEVTGPYVGLTVQEAREKIIDDLKTDKLLLRQEFVSQRQPTCWRSRNPIEFIAMSEFYLSQVAYVSDIKRMTEEIQFYPPQNKQLLLDWLNAITADWPISRRRYYGTEIPIWYCKSCKKPILPEPGPYYQPWKEDPPFNTCPSCSSTDGFIGEHRTFDTWMDSSISALIAIGYLDNPTLFKEAFPCSLRPQGKDIVRTWLNYTLLRVYQLFKAPAFQHVWISGMVLDPTGHAMHKSAGNTILPWPLLEQYGSDAFRLMGALEAGLGSDLRFNPLKIEGAYKFLTKLWNISRYVSSFPQVMEHDNPIQLRPVDHWILSELNLLIEESIKGYDKLDFSIPARLIRTFVWDLFASHYLEMVKPRAYNSMSEFVEAEQNAAWYTLHTILKVVLKLLSIISPFITEKLYRELYDKGQSIHLTGFPKPLENIDDNHTQNTSLLLDTNRVLWKIKTDNDLSLRDTLVEVWLPESLKPFINDLQTMHSIKNINLGIPTETKSYEIFEVQGAKLFIQVK